MRSLAILSVLTGSVVPTFAVLVVSFSIGPGAPDSIVPDVALFGSIGASLLGVVAGLVSVRTSSTRLPASVGILLNLLYLGGYATYQVMVRLAETSSA